MVGMTVAKNSITVTDQQDNWTKAQIETGHYGNEAKMDLVCIYWRGVEEFGSFRPTATMKPWFGALAILP